VKHLHFHLGALERLILLPNSLPSHQAVSGSGLLTTPCVIHARQVTAECVTFASQAWLSNAAADLAGK
jgi:hypothetical protein